MESIDKNKHIGKMFPFINEMLPSYTYLQVGYFFKIKIQVLVKTQ